MSKIEWIEMTDPRGMPIDMPRHQRLFGIAAGQLFVPVAAVNPRREQEILGMAVAAGCRIFWVEGHAFGPIEWVTRQSENAAVICDIVRGAAERIEAKRHD